MSNSHPDSQIVEQQRDRDSGERYVNRSYGKGDQLLVIENVRSLAARVAGASYLTAQTLHAIDRIKRERQRLMTTRPVAVAEFAPAA